MSSRRIAALSSRQCGFADCPNPIAGNDSHTACISCTGLVHAHQAASDLDALGCDACESFSAKILTARYHTALAFAGKSRGGGGGSVVAGPRPRTPGLGEAGGPSARFTSHLFIPPPPLSRLPEDSVVHCSQGYFPGPPLGLEAADGFVQPQPAYNPLSTSPPRHEDDSFSDEGLIDEEEEEEDNEDFAPHDGTEMSGDNTPAAVKPTTSPASGILSGLRVLMAPSEAGSVATGTTENSSIAAPESVPAWVVFEQAVAKLGLQFSTEERQAPAPSTMGFLGLLPPPSRPSRVKKLPVAPGFKKVLHSTWSNHAEPPKLGFNVETEDAVELGFAALPPMDPVLAYSAYLLRISAVRKLCCLAYQQHRPSQAGKGVVWPFGHSVALGGAFLKPS